MTLVFTKLCLCINVQSETNLFLMGETYPILHKCISKTQSKLQNLSLWSCWHFSPASDKVCLKSGARHLQLHCCNSSNPKKSNFQYSCYLQMPYKINCVELELFNFMRYCMYVCIYLDLVSIASFINEKLWTCDIIMK